MKSFSLALFAFALGLGLGCDRSPDGPKYSGRGGSDAQGPDGPVIIKTPNDEKLENEGTLDGNIKENPLSLLTDGGSMVRYVNADGLDVYYRRVFPKGANGYMHCSNNRPVEYADCSRSIFTLGERISMGSFDLHSTRGASNVSPVQNLTLNYTRTLRFALNRECTNLVNLEIKNLQAQALDKNVLVKSLAPTAQDFEGFYRKLLGLTGSKDPVSMGAADYASAFTKSLEGIAERDKEKAAAASFINICISIAMDPDVILY